MKRIGYTLGDQAGIGPEIVAAALNQLSPPAGIELYPLGKPISCTRGKPTELTARAALEQLETGAQALKEGSIDAIVTAPISKEALHLVGFDYPGQTEFFADRLAVSDFAMCLTGKHLTVALATIHTALRKVPYELTSENIVRVGKLLAEFCQRMRKTEAGLPRIALAGLNPHNGEQGVFGNEESTIIAPALEELQGHFSALGQFTGPHVPDVIYREAAMGSYEGIVAPYHDQALIPLKLLDFDNAVNVTLGLPRPRFSPDHGTAFSIAGKGVAKADSMRRAFELAIQWVHA